MKTKKRTAAGERLRLQGSINSLRLRAGVLKKAIADYRKRIWAAEETVEQLKAEKKEWLATVAS